jgi:DNA-binding response OmpR family regulator
MRQLLATALRKEGYEVVEAESGGKLLVTLAHQFLHTGHPDLVDLVVTDVRMPVCTGTQVLEQMRAARWRTPVILMTAFGDAALRNRARSLGAALFDKPFDVEELCKACRDLLVPLG